MLRRYLEQRHIDLDSGRSCFALEREYWQALEVWPMKMAGTTGVISSAWVPPGKPEYISLASYVRKMVTVFV